MGKGLHSYMFVLLPNRAEYTEEWVKSSIWEHREEYIYMCHSLCVHVCVCMRALQVRFSLTGYEGKVKALQRKWQLE